MVPEGDIPKVSAHFEDLNPLRVVCHLPDGFKSSDDFRSRLLQELSDVLLRDKDISKTHATLGGYPENEVSALGLLMVDHLVQE